MTPTQHISRTRTASVFSVLLVLALLLVSNVPGQAAQATRIAIIAEDETVRKEADLLTVELSQKSGLELLERTQIEKVFQEQAISATQKAGALQLGRLLGADGLIIIETQPGDRRSDLSLRLVAVKPGVVLDQISWPRPVPEPAKAVAFLAKKWDAFWPKLGVPVRDAVPVSILNLRSALKSIEGERQERELTFLLTSRLTKETELFVLERRQLQDAAFEKESTSLEEAAFWNGSYLIDGVINKDGLARDRLTLSVRLVSPNKQETVLEVVGKPDQPTECVEALVAKLLSTIRKSPKAAAWQPHGSRAMKHNSIWKRLNGR